MPSPGATYHRSAGLVREQGHLGDPIDLWALTGAGEEATFVADADFYADPGWAPLLSSMEVCGTPAERSRITSACTPRSAP